MLDLSTYDHVPLRRRPPLQRLIADTLLRYDYRNVEIVLEGQARIPRTSVLFAMNHTDRYNFWPLQYWMHRHWGRYTATWVKGKNYEHPVLERFMRWSNNIPIASRGYLITRDFVSALDRRPTAEEYRLLREAVDGQQTSAAIEEAAWGRALLERPRDMLGRRFDPSRETYVQAVEALYAQMMRRFLEMNRHALSIGLDLLVFPQGSRSVRLSRGHIGVAQAALALGVPVVPVGCNGSDLLYPGTSPWSLPGSVTCRVGEPMEPEAFADLAPSEAYEPFTRDAETTHRAAFQAITDRIMDAIDPLLDERHRYAPDRSSDGTHGTDRFL